MFTTRSCSILPAIAILTLSLPSASAQQFAPMMENSIFSWTNIVRQQQGRGQLAPNAKLTRAAQAHAAHMAARGIMAHNLDGSTLVDRVNRTGYAYMNLGENVAYNYGYDYPAWQLFDGWMKSEPHLRNIMKEEFMELGVGVALSPSGRYYACQVFGRPASMMPPRFTPYPSPYSPFSGGPPQLKFSPR